MIARVATILFALLAATLGAAAGLDVYLHGRLTVLDPLMLGGVGVIGIAFLLFDILVTHKRALDLEGRSDRLAQLAKELESFIAALEAANARLNASEARYKGLVDAQGDAILRRTSDGRVTYANEGFLKLFGLRQDEVIGQVFRPEPHPDSPPPMVGRLAGRETGRERVSYDQHIKTIAGFRWIAWEDYPIRDSDGRMLEIQSVGRDITERKTLEAALMIARDKAEEASRAKSYFLATMSHEIRTPMNGVLGMARLILETPLAPDQKTYADAIRQSGLSLLGLIEDILDFSKIESGSLIIEKSDVALRQLIEGIAELLSTRAQAKGIEIATAIAADVPDIIPADGIRLRQVLTNLIGNAIKFTEEGGVLVSASVEHNADGPGGWLCLSVRDTGVGVAPEKQAQIFEDFVQADSSHARRFEGTGLGLAISKRLVQAMGGGIGMRSAEDRGSIFWVRLPLDDIKVRVPSQPFKKKRVGIVSVSALLRTGLKLQLQDAGAEIAEAASLEALLGETRVDVVLIDTVRGAEDIPNLTERGVKAVALLPPGQRTRASQLSAKGLSGYLVKPVRQDSLEKRLVAVLAGEVELETPAPAPAVQSRPGRGLSILLAEDNPVNALLARELLRRRGHTVREVKHGEAAVEACAAEYFDIVIMDVHMPRLDGIEATQRIRQAESASGAKRVPIFALTADAVEAGRKACLEAGMDGFLTKPLDPAELDAVLVTIIPRTHAAA